MSSNKIYYLLYWKLKVSRSKLQPHYLITYLANIISLLTYKTKIEFFFQAHPSISLINMKCFKDEIKGIGFGMTKAN